MQALSRMIDCSEFQLTFIGTMSREFPLEKNKTCVKLLSPQDSEEIAKYLLTQDILKSFQLYSQLHLC